ncbi:MAG: hypothetical protein AAF703_20720 [Cyanobacteria bacterium P01_D01_bin.105]
MAHYYQLMLKACSLLTISLIVFGCSGVEKDVSAPAADASAVVQTEGQSEQQTAAEKIKFKQADGAEKYSLKFKADGAKFVDADDNEIARLKVDDRQKVKIKAADETVLGYVVTKDGYWKLENAAQSEELYILRLQGDGDLKLEDGQDKQIYRIKKRDYGYEIETPEKRSLYKVKVKAGKTSLRDANEDTVISTKSPISPAAMTPFGFDVLSPPQQAAFAYAVNGSNVN